MLNRSELIDWLRWFRIAYFARLQEVMDLTKERDGLRTELHIADETGIEALRERNEARALARKFHAELERKICKC